MRANDFEPCSKGHEAMTFGKSKIDTFFRKYYTPILMNDFVRLGVIVAFAFLTSVSIWSISNAAVGLDQDLSVPKDSYVFRYFEAMETYLMVGVPVFFVVEGRFAYEEDPSRKLICGISGCDPYSLVEQVNRASKQPHFTSIETPPSAWIDDYVDWLMPKSNCCRRFTARVTKSVFIRADIIPEKMSHIVP